MCERQAKILKLSEIRSRIGNCSVNCKKGTISLSIIDLSEEKLQYLEKIAQLDQTSHSRTYQRWIVNFGIQIINDEIQI